MTTVVSAAAAVGAALGFAAVGWPVPRIGPGDELVIAVVAWLVLAALAAAGSLNRWRRVDPGEGNWGALARVEPMTAHKLHPLAARGWTILHDRVVPGTGTGLPHIAIGPSGFVVIVDAVDPRPSAGDPHAPGLSAAASTARSATGEVLSVLGDLLDRVGIGVTPAVVVHDRRFGIPPQGVDVDGVPTLPVARLPLWLELDRARLAPVDAAHLAAKADAAFPPSAAAIPDDLASLVKPTARPRSDPGPADRP